MVRVSEGKIVNFSIRVTKYIRASGNLGTCIGGRPMKATCIIYYGNQNYETNQSLSDYLDTLSFRNHNK